MSSYQRPVISSKFTIHHSQFTISPSLTIDYWLLTIDHFFSVPRVPTSSYPSNIAAALSPAVLTKVGKKNRKKGKARGDGGQPPVGSNPTQLTMADNPFSPPVALCKKAKRTGVSRLSVTLSRGKERAKRISRMKLCREAVRMVTNGPSKRRNNSAFCPPCWARSSKRGMVIRGTTAGWF